MQFAICIFLFFHYSFFHLKCCLEENHLKYGYSCKSCYHLSYVGDRIC